MNSRQRGNAIVEFALVLPVLIIITFGTVDVGRYAYYAILISNAARAGAAYGAQNEITANDVTGIEAAANADAGSASSQISFPTAPTFFCQNSSHANVSCTSGSVTSTYVQVAVRGTFKPLLKYPAVPASLTINNTAKMRIYCTVC